MATNKKLIETRVHELYVRYLLLLGKVTPVALKVVISDTVAKQRKSLPTILEEKKEFFKKNYYQSYVCLFQEHDVNTEVDSWDIALLCDVIFVLLEAEEHENIQCISDHRRDIESYTESASLGYETFKKKWESLQGAILELIRDREGEGKYECNCLIHSYKESKPITMGQVQVEEMKKTTDLKEHILIAIMIADSPGNIRNRSFKDESENGNSIKPERTAKFVKLLEDTFLKLGDATGLVCELETAITLVQWRKNGEPINETDNIKFVTNNRMAWLLLANANLDDTGEYSCICENVSTSAFLTVTENDLKVVEKLHVVERDVREEMEISLVCSVNIPTKIPKWFHRKKEITPSARVFPSSEGLQHKLIIRRAMFDDDGEYIIAFDRAASRTLISVKGIFDLKIKQQLKKDLYRNWVRAVLGLKYLKLGLEGVSDKAAERHHQDLMKRLLPEKGCTNCNVDNLLPVHKSRNQCYRKQNKSSCICSKSHKYRRECPTGGFCSNFYDSIVLDHQFEDPLLINTKIEKWSSDRWSVAKCYISTPGYEGKTSSKEVDCAGLLSLFINNKTYLSKANTGVFEIARRKRNGILHNANYELFEYKLEKYLDYFKDVLKEVKNDSSMEALANKPQIEESLHALDELKNHQIEIETAEEIQSLKEHAMDEAAEAIKEAKEKNEEELQLLKEKIEQSEKELQLLREIQALPKNVDDLDQEGEAIHQKILLKLTIQIHISARGESPGHVLKSVHELIQTEVEYLRNQTSDTKTLADCNNKGTSKVIHHLLLSIVTTKGTMVENVLKNETEKVISFEIKCTSSESLGKLLAVFHGTEFQARTAELKKCLDKEEKGQRTYNVETSCSSTSIDTIRKSLHDCGILKGHPDDLSYEKLDSERKCDQLVVKAPKVSERISLKTCQEEIEKNNVDDRIVHYNVGHNSDKHGCSIISVCSLPEGQILICDEINTNLKKLTFTYDVISCIPLPNNATDVLYIGNNEAAVAQRSLSSHILIVNVLGKMNHKRQVELKYNVNSLAYYDGLLYACDRETVRVGNRYGEHGKVLFQKPTIKDIFFHRITVSDDGKNIFITRTDCLLVIDNKGNHLSTLTTEEITGQKEVKYPFDICFIGGGSVLVCDSLSGILQIDSKGTKVLRKLFTKHKLPATPRTLCWDRQHLRLIVCYAEDNYITVFQLKYVRNM